MVILVLIVFVGIASSLNLLNNYFNGPGCQGTPDAFMTVNEAQLFQIQYPVGIVEDLGNGCINFPNYNVSGRIECNATGIYVLGYNDFGCDPEKFAYEGPALDGHATVPGDCLKGYKDQYSAQIHCSVPDDQINTNYAHFIKFLSGAIGCTSTNLRDVGVDLYAKFGECISMDTHGMMCTKNTEGQVVYNEYYYINCTNLKFSTVFSTGECKEDLDRRSGGVNVIFKGYGAKDAASQDSGTATDDESVGFVHVVLSVLVLAILFL